MIKWVTKQTYFSDQRRCAKFSVGDFIKEKLNKIFALNFDVDFHKSTGKLLQLNTDIVHHNLIDVYAFGKKLSKCGVPGKDIREKAYIKNEIKEMKKEEELQKWAEFQRNEQRVWKTSLLR